nr:hypothetical protein [Tanacetum cinerariifolium]
MVLPFSCLDDSESDTEMPEKHVSPTPHDVMLTRALTVRKSIRPLPSHHLALKYTSHHLDRFTSGSSSGHSSSDRSSSGHSTSGHSLSGHASPDTNIADSSTLPRFVYPPLAMTLQCSEVYLCWRPSHKRCRSLATIVTSSIHDTRGLVHSHADLLLPCKRFTDSISLEDSVEEDIDAYEMADIKADATAVEVVVDRDVEAEVDACIGIEVDVRIDVEDEVESNDRGTIEVRVDVVARIDIPDEIPIQRIEDIKTRQKELKARSLIAGGERASLLEQVASLERSNAESQSQNGSDGKNGNGGNRNGENGNGRNRNGGNGNPNKNDRGTRLVAREYTYQDIMKCQPLNFKERKELSG